MNIILILLFCFFNSRILKVKGRKSGGIIAATIGLCLGMSFLSTMILTLIKFPIMDFAEAIAAGETSMSDMYTDMIQTAVDDPMFVYIPYVATLVGGMISLLIARAYKPNTEQFNANNYNRNAANGQNGAGNNTWQNGNGNPWQSNMNNGTANPWQNNTDNGNTWYNGSGNPWQNNQNGSGSGGSYSSQVFGKTSGSWNSGNSFNDIPMGASMDGGACGSQNAISTPCTICVIRDPSTMKTEEIYTVSLNGHPVCRLGNNTYANFMTMEKQNTVTARDGAGMSLKKPITFLAKDGGMVEIHIKGDCFIPDKTVGKRPHEDK